MLSMTLAVVVVAVLGMAFSSTRNVGLLATALLCFMYPVLVIVLVLMGGGVFIYQRRSKL
jgi:hypothetical protein